MKKIIIIFIVWRIFITVAMIFGLMLPVQITFLGTGVDNYFDNPLIYSWANFDGVHYWSIANVGYKQFEQVFFPLYPIFIRLIEDFFHTNAVLAGLLISNIAIFIATLIFYKLIILDYSENTAIWSILFLLFSPTSFYFASVYTESLFLLLIVASFYAGRKKRWLLAGFAGLFASATRIVGVFLLPALAIEYFLIRKRSITSHTRANGNLYNNYCIDPLIKSEDDKKHSMSIIWLFLVPLGLATYMFWLNQNYGDPLYFFHVQSLLGANRSSGNFVLLPQVVFRYLKIFFTASFNYQYLIALIEFLTTILSYLLIFLGLKKTRISYIIFSLISLTIPTLTGTLLSMPRFVITIFPLFIILALLNISERKRKIILSFFIVLLFIMTMLFTRGYWIA